MFPRRVHRQVYCFTCKMINHFSKYPTRLFYPILCIGTQQRCQHYSGVKKMCIRDRSICVIFNGEIYNYEEIREELKSKGHVFYTATDTEVLVHLYEEYGTGFFNKLNGIFAFALLDQNNNRLILARDHFGTKPLHYFLKDGVLVFGSEQKSIILHPKYERKLNLKALHIHLSLIHISISTNDQQDL